MTSSPPVFATQTVLTRVLELLSSVNHAQRKGLDAEARHALVDAATTARRQVEALCVVLVGEADRAKAPEVARGTSMRSLLARSTMLTAGEAAGLVFAGQELTGRAAVRDAALAGEVSVGQARAIDRVLGELPAKLTDEQRTEAESLLLRKAQVMDAKRLVGQARSVLDEVAPEVDAVEHELANLDAQRKRAWSARSFRMTPDGEGSVLLRGQLPALEGEALQKLIASYSMSNRQAMEHAADRHDPAGLRTFEQRTADGLIAWVAANSGSGSASTASRRQRSTVLVTMSYDALTSRQEQAGYLPGGEALSAGELRRLLCDAGVMPVVLGGASQPLDVGREQRLVTPDLRRALELRDGGCAFPGWEVPSYSCEAHHIVPWYTGGPTALENLVLLCPHHHGTVEPLRFWGGASAPIRGAVPEFRTEVSTHPERSEHALLMDVTLEGHTVDWPLAGRESIRAMGVHERQVNPLPSLLSFQPDERDRLLTSPDVVRFPCVRNPYARLASAWADKIRMVEPGYQHLIPKIAAAGGEVFDAGRPVSFASFVAWLDAGDTRDYRDSHWWPQHELVLWKEIDYRHVLRVESLADDLQRVLTDVEARVTAAELLAASRINESLPLDWHTLYDESLAATVARLFADDFALFGYDVESWRRDPQGSATPLARALAAEARAKRLEASAIEVIRARNEALEDLYRRIDGLESAHPPSWPSVTREATGRSVRRLRSALGRTRRRIIRRLGNR